MPDVMHDLLEGAMQYEAKLMLREMISWSWKGSGATRQLISKKDELMYIPILKTLESMLQCDDTNFLLCLLALAFRLRRDTRTPGLGY